MMRMTSKLCGRWRVVAACVCAAWAGDGLAPAVEQGLDPVTGIVHNGQWQSGVPLGGLGCGRFEVLPSGWFSRFSINHNWDEPTGHQPWKPSRATFFAVRAGETARWLRFGFREQELPGVTQVEHVAYRGRFPFIDATFHDAALPVGVAMHAWCSLVPHNAKDSSLPVAFFEFTLENTNAQPQEVSLLFSLEHFIGCGGYQVQGDHRTWREQEGNRVEPAAVKETPLTGLRFFSTKQFEGMKLNSSGEYWLLSDGPTTATGWDAAGDGKPLLDLLSANPPSSTLHPPSSTTAGAICRKMSIPANSRQKVLFTFVWWMPNHVTMDGKVQGHYYQRSFNDPASLAAYAVAQRGRLARETAAWRKPILDSNLPEWMKRMILDGTHPMFTNTLLTRDGEFAVHEDPSWMEGALGTLDQRTVAHVFATTFFPELSRGELELFRRCQQPDGEITHFCGNIYQTVGDARVHYGITRWPDLPAVYIWQVLKTYRWTGDRDLLDKSWPAIQRALDWLAAADRDGDGVPEGGTTYDSGVQYGGNFVFTASVYCAALQCAIEMARIQGDDATRKLCEQRLERARAGLQQLWTGQFFAKCHLPDRRMLVPTVFTPQLAGDWLMRIAGLPRVATREQTRSSLESLFQINGRNSPWPIADEFTPDGRSHNDRCWFTYQWTYFAGVAMAEGFSDDAMEVAWRSYDALYNRLNIPWGMYLNLMPSLTDHPQAGGSYMSAMTGWWWPHQLAGAAVDVSGQTLWLSPQTTRDLPELHLPLFYPRAWLWLDFAPAKKVFQLKVLRSFGEPMVFKRVGRDANTSAIELKEPFVAKEGATLDLDSWRDKLAAEPARAPILEHKAYPRHHEGLPTLAWTTTVSDMESNCHPDDACDGYEHSRWESSKPASPGLWWQLDMGRMESFKSVNAVTSPPGLVIELSDNGTQWRLMNPGDAQHQARHLRLRPLVLVPVTEPWRIFEVSVNP